MKQFRRVAKVKEPQEIKPNEIRITSLGRQRSYISYCVSLLTGKAESVEQNNQEYKKFDEITIKAMRMVINKAISVAEIVKRRVKGVHQITEIESTSVVDEWEPMEEGLEKVTTSRTVSSIKIILSTKPLDKNNPGYQPPLSEDEVKPYQSPKIFEENNERRDVGQRRNFRGRFRRTNFGMRTGFRGRFSNQNRGGRFASRGGRFTNRGRGFANRRFSNRGFSNRGGGCFGFDGVGNGWICIPCTPLRTLISGQNNKCR